MDDCSIVLDNLDQRLKPLVLQVIFAQINMSDV